MTPDEFARRLGDAYPAWVEETLGMVVAVVERNVKKRTPVVTGTLRRSITGRVEAAAERGVVGTNLIYARPVNRRRQFMEKGLADSEVEIGQVLADQGAEIFSAVTS